MFVLITGASRGLGAAIAKKLYDDGHELLLLARQFSTLDAWLRSIAQPERVQCLSCDLSQWSAEYPQQLTHSRPDVVIHNAAVYAEEPVLSQDFGELLLQQMALNVLAIQKLDRHFFPMFRQMAKGKVIYINSVVAKNPSEKAATYSIAKAALAAYVTLMMPEWQSIGVAATQLSPGAIHTSSWDGTDHSVLQTLIQPEDIAALIQQLLCLGPQCWVKQIDLAPLQAALD